MNRREISHSRDEVRAEIDRRLKENPNLGPQEFTVKLLEQKGIACTGKSPLEIRKILKTLSLADKKEIRDSLDRYSEFQSDSIKNFRKGLSNPFGRLTGACIKTLSKGAAVGTSIAGVINTLAPNLVPTGLGYLAGAGHYSTLAKLGLVAAGSLTPTVAGHAVILGVGAAAGAAVYTASKLVVGAGKGIAHASRKRREKKEAKIPSDYVNPFYDNLPDDNEEIPDDDGHDF